MTLAPRLAFGASLLLSCSESTTSDVAQRADTPSVPNDTEEFEISEDSAQTVDVPFDVVPEVPVLADLGPQPTTTTEWRWLGHHDGTGVGAVTLAEPGLVEYVRFDVEGRFRIRAIRAQVDVAKAGTLTLRVLDDFGGDGISLSLDRELARASKAVTPADSGTVVTVPLEPPLEVPTGRMFYVATVWESAASPRLRVDAAPTGAPAGFSPSSLLWQSKAIDPATGAATVFSTAPGDYVVDLELEQVDLVAPEDQLFEPMGVETPSISRAALDDIDGDGDLDIMGDGARLWLGRGDGTFEDVSATALPAGISWNGGAFGDYDGDGDPDWFGTGDADVLLRNNGGTFVDVTAASGIDDTQEHTCNGAAGPKHVPTEASAWLDYDGDGRLDLYQGNFICWDDGLPSRDKLWHNRGDGTFEDVSATAGIDAAQGPGYASRGVAPADYDGDGDMDILVTNYRLHRSLHLRNDGGVFTDVGKETGLEAKATPLGSGVSYGHSIGAAWGDFDHDGRLDVFVARLAHPRFMSFSDPQSLYYGPSVGAPDAFRNLTDDFGIRYQETPSNPNAWDFDNDGDLDLFWTAIYEGRRSQLYRNEWPTPGWTEVNQASGLIVLNGWGSVTGDFDGDGDLDLLARTAFRNRNRFGNYAIQIRPRGLGAGHSNTSGIGARVIVKVAGKERLQERAGSHGTGSGDSPWLHVGLGRATSAPVRVVFPTTGVVVDAGVLTAGRYTISEDGQVVAD